MSTTPSWKMAIQPKDTATGSRIPSDRANRAKIAVLTARPSQNSHAPLPSVHSLASTKATRSRVATPATKPTPTRIFMST